MSHVSHQQETKRSLCKLLHEITHASAHLLPVKVGSRRLHHVYMNVHHNGVVLQHGRE